MWFTKKAGFFLIIGILALALLLPSCRKSGQAVVQPAGQGYTAQLIGLEEVPPITSQAKAQAFFLLSADGMTLNYKLVASDIQNVMQAHLHLAAKGQNGQVVAWLYPANAPAVKIPGRFDGVLGEGNLTAASLVGPLAGQPLSALVARINAGEIYVNIHTEQSPSGEIRGQVYLQDANAPLAALSSNIVGIVTTINGNSVSVQTDTRVVTVTRDANTVIETADVGPSAQLAAGAPVQVYFDPATFIASTIELEKPGDIITQVATVFVNGSVVSFSGSSLILQTASGEKIFVEVITGTILQYEDGTPASLADIKPGAMIEANVRIGARWAIRIEVKR
ncbi:MAG: CHRD domain-containing protein [Dehalococcoidales bacterium]|nr:CHRD domain-containing protein [Dehalococcoidales bacterium]